MVSKIVPEPYLIAGVTVVNFLCLNDLFLSIKIIPDKLFNSKNSNLIYVYTNISNINFPTPIFNKVLEKMLSKDLEHLCDCLIMINLFEPNKDYNG